MSPCHHVTMSLFVILPDESVLDFEFYHTQNIGLQAKNGQATLERGTSFDGKHAYDSTDLSVVLTRTDNEVTERMSVQRSCTEYKTSRAFGP